MLGNSYDVALDMMEELRNAQKMDNGLFTTYTNIFFVPMDDFGVRLLRILTLPNWYERLQQGLFKREVRSFGKGSFTYYACLFWMVICGGCSASGRQFCHERATFAYTAFTSRLTFYGGILGIG